MSSHEWCLDQLKRCSTLLDDRPPPPSLGLEIHFPVAARTMPQESCLENVPLNKLFDARKQAMDAVDKAFGKAMSFTQRDEMYAIGEDRAPLLCNTGAAGWGKTTTLKLSMRHFVKENVGSHAVFVDFNGMQKLGSHVPPPSEEEAFIHREISKRILHSVVHGFHGMTWGDFRTAVDEKPIKYICIHDAISAVRTFLQMAPSSHLLLTCDELLNVGQQIDCASSYTSPATAGQVSRGTVSVLHTLCTVYDESISQAWMNRRANSSAPAGITMLCVSAYEAVDLTQLETKSRRPLTFQPLPPLQVMGATNPFLDPANKPCGDDRMRFRELLMYTGGRPRRVRAAASELALFVPGGDKAATVRRAREDADRLSPIQIQEFCRVQKLQTGDVDHLDVIRALFIPSSPVTSVALAIAPSYGLAARWHH